LAVPGESDVYECLVYYCSYLPTEPVERPPYHPVGGLTYAQGLMLRDFALLLVNRPKKNIFLLNVPLKWLPQEAFFSTKCTKYRLAAGLHPDPLGSLQRSPDS